MLLPSGRVTDLTLKRQGHGSGRGSVMVGGQKIQVGLTHARKTVQVTVGSDTYVIAVEPGITVTAPRTSSRDIRRRKASNYHRQPAAPQELLTVRASGRRL